MNIDYTKYKNDYEIQLNDFAYFYDAHEKSVLTDEFLHESFFKMANDYLQVANLVFERSYNACEKKDYESITIGPMVYLYNHAIELYVKAIAYKLKLNKISGHDSNKIFKEIKNALKDQEYISLDELEECSKLIEKCTKYNEKSQIGRYPIDNQKNALGINEEGVVRIRIVLYSKVVNDAMNKLNELYGNVEFAIRFTKQITENVNIYKYSDITNKKQTIY